VHIVDRILDGVVEEIGKGRPQFLGIAVDQQALRWRRCDLEREGLRREVMTQSRRLQDFGRERRNVDRPAMLQRDPLAGDAGLQYLFDRPLQAVGVEQHDAVELALLRLADVARLQCFQV
jgi:hypothetical protein